MPQPTWLQAFLDDHLVLAQPGGHRLLVLNPMAAWIWQSQMAGLSKQTIAELLTQRFGLTAQQIQSALDVCASQCQVLSQQTESNDQVSFVTRPRVQRPTVSAARWVLQFADQWIELVIDDARIAAQLEPILRHLRCPSLVAFSHQMALHGNSTQWNLLLDDQILCHGTDLDQAITETVIALVECGCDSRQRLLVAHAAGVTLESRTLLLIGASGAGKTTLATHLNAKGFGLLSDDTVPITLHQDLLGIGMSLCLKEGSWSLFAQTLPHLTTIVPIQRAGRRVRFLPPPGPVIQQPVKLGAFVFVLYQADAQPQCTSLTPVEVLQLLIATNTLILELNQVKLDALTTWLQSAPAFRLVYPNLETAEHMLLDLVSKIGSRSSVGIQREVEQ